MENASKAIIMAGGILIGVIILTALVLIFRPVGDVYEGQGEALTTEQLEKYNRKFNTFDRSLYGSEILSLKNLLEDYNNRVLQVADEKFRKENEIEVTVKLYRYDVSELIDSKGVVKRTKYTNKSLIGEYILVETESTKATGKKGDLKNFLETIEANINNGSNAETLQKEFKNLPFKCISDRTVYNSAGRIKSMYFEQVIDENYEVYN